MSLPVALDRYLRELLASDRVRCVLGPAASPGPRGTARLARRQDQLESLSLSPLASPNLLVHLTSEEARRDATRRPVAVIARPCETRMLNQLLSERAICRDELHVVGLSGCHGVIDTRRLLERVPDLQGFPAVRDDGDAFVIASGEDELRLPRHELLKERCVGCETREPLFCDHEFPLSDDAGAQADAAEEAARSPSQDDTGRPEALSVTADAARRPEPVAELEASSTDERWHYWSRQLERCIRCHACRDACPLCYCEDCVLERLQPTWVPRSVGLRQNTAYQLIRVLHLTGRCTACGACEEACPVGLPLLTLARKMEKDVQELYGHRSGFDAEGSHALSIFDPDDPQESHFEEH